MNKLFILLLFSLLTGCKEYDPVWQEPIGVEDDNDGNPSNTDVYPSPYITKVLDFCPAPGQFTNLMPKYTAGDTRQSMNNKVLQAIGHNNRGMISLGGWGGYVVVGFDHRIENILGEYDFRVHGNSFCQANAYAGQGSYGGNCEPGIIMVACDVNGNGIPDDDEWFEIAGRCHRAPMSEPWLEYARAHGCDVEFYSDYHITYHLLDNDAIGWKDNKNGVGTMNKNAYYTQCYFPMWMSEKQLDFSGTRLPQNAVDVYGTGQSFVLFSMGWGYADNGLNNSDDTCIDISWAVAQDGSQANLPGVDFIKVYTGVRQDSPNLGECSTELSGITDLHLFRPRSPIFVNAGAVKRRADVFAQ